MNWARNLKIWTKSNISGIVKPFDCVIIQRDGLQRILDWDELNTAYILPIFSAFFFFLYIPVIATFTFLQTKSISVSKQVGYFV